MNSEYKLVRCKHVEGQLGKVTIIKNDDQLPNTFGDFADYVCLGQAAASEVNMTEWVHRDEKDLYIERRKVK